METKQFWKTSEFWLTVATNAANILLYLSGVIDGKWAGILATVSNALYAVSRGIAKQGVAPTPPPPK